MNPFPLFLFALLQGAATPPKPLPDAVLATLDGAPITAAEIEPYLWAWKTRDVVREVADHRMVLEAATKRGVGASDAEVKARLQLQLTAIASNLPPGQTVEAYLEGRGLNVPHLAVLSRSAVLLDKIAEGEFKPSGYVRVQTIVVPTKGDTTDALSGAIRKADLAYAALQAGKPWEAVLKANGADPSVAETGGLLGWKSLDLFPESVRAAFATMRPLGYTKPTQTPNGIQIFRLVARGEAATPAEAADLKRQFVEGYRAVILQRIRSEARIEIK